MIFRKRLVAAAAVLTLSAILAPPPARAPAAWQKQGCGMDPNGERICEPGAGTSQAAQPASTGTLLLPDLHAHDVKAGVHVDGTAGDAGG